MASENRVRYAAAAVFMQILLGVIYSWSIFRGPLALLHGWSKSQTFGPLRSCQNPAMIIPAANERSE